jgi:uncharacterized membrane protein YfcA
MGLYSLVFLGSTPLGGPLTGWLAEAVDPRAGLVLAGVAALGAGAGAWLAVTRARRRRATAERRGEGPRALPEPAEAEAR